MLFCSISLFFSGSGLQQVHDQSFFSNESQRSFPSGVGRGGVQPHIDHPVHQAGSQCTAAPPQQQQVHHVHHSQSDAG